METQPLVSIITPSYNQAPFLEQTIQSVLGQDYPRLEYLIVDGGSTDGSPDIIHHYSDRLAWWVSEKDQGQADAINKALRRSKGEIIAWLNSDDLYEPGTITEIVRFFKSNPQIGLAFGNVRAIDDTSRTINVLKYGPWGLADLMSFSIIGQPAVFMRRSALEQAGMLDTSYHYLLDHHLWIRIAQIAEIQYIPRTLAAARYHAAAKNISHPAEFTSEATRILEWMKSQPGLAPLLSRNKKRIQAGLCRLSAFYLTDGGQPAAALKAYWRGFWFHPPTILTAWRRVLYTKLSLVGLGRLHIFYSRLRRGIKSTP